MFDLTDRIIRFEGGEATDEEIIELFQYLVDTGLAWQLQGFYGRTARDLILAGVVRVNPEATKGRGDVMGTRSLTKFYHDGSKRPFVTMYRQFDGYPSGHGVELAEFLASTKAVNGISLSEKQRIANGIECLAAQVVAQFKEEPGGIYLVSNVGGHGEEYVYEVRERCDGTPGAPVAGTITRVRTPIGWKFKVATAHWKTGRIEKVLFEGDPADFLKGLPEEA